MVGWLWLLSAVFFEVCGATTMKISQGFSKPLPSILLFAFYSMSVISFTLTLKHLPLHLAYVAWAGLGTVCIVLVSFFHFQASVGIAKLFFILLTLFGLIGLQTAQ